MLRAEARVTLRLLGPILTRQSTPGAPGVDDAMARHDGRPMLPYSLIQGRLREAWREIGAALDPPVDAARLAELLGSASRSVDDEHAATPTAPTSWHPARGRLSFSDFVATTPAGPATTVPVATRLRRDSERRAALDGALRHVETPFAPGQEVCFAGQVRWLARDAEEGQTLAEQLRQGLRWIGSLGAERTAGFGRLVGVELEWSAAAATPGTVTGGSSFELRLTFADALCLAGQPEGGNLFESSDVVPGAVIKGTVARSLQQWAGLPAGSELAASADSFPEPFAAVARHFSALRFLHAFPAAPGAPRPWVAPESLVKARSGQLVDIALCDGSAVLLEGAAPAFALDWKNDDDVTDLRGWQRPARELRVRTAIDPKTRRGADEQLFAYEMVRPEGVEWVGGVDLEAVPETERRAVESGLRQVLEGGLVGIGKTSAATRAVTLTPAPVTEPWTEFEADKVWVVTLQTPALLVDPTKLDEASTAQAIGEQYEAAWKDLSGGRLTVIRRFTRERLAGGYLGLRFGQPGAYRPFLLTAEGSTFVLAATGDGDAGKWLADVSRRGLELPTWVRERHGTTWKTCPFTREDGFGEVAVNLAVHGSHRPSEKDVKFEVLP